MYSREIKRLCLRLYDTGVGIDTICATYSVARSTLYRWIKENQYLDPAASEITLADIHRMKQHINKLERIMTLIKETGIISAIPLQQRLKACAELQEKGEYSIREICEAMQVDRGTFYNHIFRKADPTKRMQEREKLARQVKQIFDDSDQRFGAEKIKRVLGEYGIKVGYTRVHTLMTEMGLESIRTDAKHEYKKQQARQKKNLLKRDFTAQKPNEIWVSDITYFKLPSGDRMFLCVIIDLFSRKVVGYKVSQTASTQLVTSAFRRAFSERGCPRNLLFHSDRGTQYVSHAFVKLLSTNGVKQSFSATGNPYDNAVAETFFATFKKEEAYRRAYTSVRDFIKHVNEYIIFYNELRPHKTLAYQIPIRFEERYYERNRKISE